MFTTKNFLKNLENNNKFFFVHLVLIIFFSIIYFNVAKKYGNEVDKVFSESYEQTLYYTVMTHFTVGFGGIRPISKIMRRITICHVILAFLFFNI